MSMPTLSFDDDHPLVDPDQLKMPEADGHRCAVDLIGLAAIRLLGPEFRVFRDMNWYPTGGGNPVAPDLMVLPADATEPRPTSYRQDQTDGPSPTVVVEVPSECDSFVSFREKAFRYQSLGTTVYLVVVEGACSVLRLGADDTEPLLVDRPSHPRTGWPPPRLRPRRAGGHPARRPAGHQRRCPVGPTPPTDQRRPPADRARPVGWPTRLKPGLTKHSDGSWRPWASQPEV